MKIVQHSYQKKGKIVFVFENWPHSAVIMVPIKNYYFIRFVKWDERDPVVTREDLEQMEWAANRMLGCSHFYRNRKALTLNP
ncbi:MULTISPECIES: hypothetical protein [Bacillus]|uniref:Uncharacterized protein n=1 Tax=Bacillus gobiensis TaxID=1441095 RepID=A0A0M4FNK6_9BACI|nr:MULTISPECIES: hypothetical protein [Bacillus]ALC84217.1 hypothetical protein AM592_11740 [Bacillus gobiensis]MED1095701.1 hypothetical protein [Bacillus capparidis]